MQALGNSVLLTQIPAQSPYQRNSLSAPENADSCPFSCGQRAAGVSDLHEALPCGLAVVVAVT